MRVRLKRGWSRTYPELTIGNVYRVLGIENDLLRIVSDAGEPILFTPKAFEFVDATQPATWISERGDDGELYAYPPELDKPFSFEEFFDYEMSARSTFHGYVHKLCHEDVETMVYPPNSFIRVQCRRSNADAPVTRYSELDEERWEVRRVEVFADGRITHADGKGSTANTLLGDAPVPPLAEISTDAQFVAIEIGRDEFEAAWTRAQDAEISGDAC